MSFLIFLLAMLTGNAGACSEEMQERKDDTPLFSFGIIADAQYCDCDPEGNRYFRNSAAKLEEAMQFFSAEKPDLILDLGDLIDRNYSSYTTVNNIFDRYNIPVIHVPGNHDYNIERKYIKNLAFGNYGSGCYSGNHHGFRFIVLNGNEISTYGPGSKSQREKAEKLITAMKAEGKINAETWNGGLSEKQLVWLSRELDMADSAGEKVFIACHFPVWPDDSHVLLNQEAVLEILKQHDNIIAWLAGHDHKGNYGNFNFIHCVTFRGMVETETENSFAVVDVYRNKIWIRGYGREKSRILAY